MSILVDHNTGRAGPFRSTVSGGCREKADDEDTCGDLDGSRRGYVSADGIRSIRSNEQRAVSLTDRGG